jgi:hypothetical protein
MIGVSSKLERIRTALRQVHEADNERRPAALAQLWAMVVSDPRTMVELSLTHGFFPELTEALELAQKQRLAVLPYQ